MSDVDTMTIGILTLVVIAMIIMRNVVSGGPLALGRDLLPRVVGVRRDRRINFLVLTVIYVLAYVYVYNY